MKPSLRVLFCFVVSTSVAATVQAGTISGFTAVHDTTTDRIQFTFDLVPVDATTPLGVDQFYFNYNPESASPFIAGTTLLDSTIAGASIIPPIPTAFGGDEIFVEFPVLTSPTTVSLIFGGVDAAAGLAASDLELFLNPTFGPSGSSLGVQAFDPITTTFISGSVPPSLTSVPEPSTFIAFAGLAFLGLADRRRRRRVV